MEKDVFKPKLFSILKEGYSRKQFSKDVIAGIIVGIVALPLAIAFGIASGVTPEKGLVTAIIAGFIISAFGGSRVQIGGPTGAFIVIVYGIVQQYGIGGLTIATLIAGFILVLMGLARLGSVIQFIPHPLIVGFTSGIAVLIFSSQIKDFLGLEISLVPAEFIEKWTAYFTHINSIDFFAAGIGIFTVITTFYFYKITTKIPGALAAILLTTLAVQLFHIPVETIETRFGSIPSSLPVPHLPDIDFETIKALIKPAFTIALLGAIESLLSAVVADGMIGGRHRSNMELIAQGAANIFSSVFGGIPATGAIARTATNVKNGGRTPVAGIIHALVLLLIMLFVGTWAKLIPLSCLAGILVVVAYNMSEWRSFVSVLKGDWSDIVVITLTFLLTIMVDLTVAIEVGMVLAAFLFMRRMAKISNVSLMTDDFGEKTEDQNDPEATEKLLIPKGVEVYEVNGPLFFAAAHNFKETLTRTNRSPKYLIIRMRFVPIIDGTGIHNLKEVLKEFKAQGTKTVLSGIQPDVMGSLEKAGLVDWLGRENVCKDIQAALNRVGELLEQES